MRACSFGKEFYSEMMGHTTVVTQLVQMITRPLADAQFAMRSFSRVFSYPELFDSALAVILCLATNIEDLTLLGGSGLMTIDVLRIPWGNLEDRVDIFPFQKLKSFKAGSGCEGIILPSTTSLRLEDFRTSYNSPREPFNWPYGRNHPGEILQTLEVINVDFDPYWFENVLASPNMRGLKQIRVRGAGGSQTHNWLTYDLKRISDTLATYLLSLEALEWSSQNWGEDGVFVPTIGTLGYLRALS
jgi:hypothetical protein